MQRDISDALRDAAVVAWSMEELRPASVPITNGFELKDATLIYHQARRIAPKHYEIVRNEIENMLRAGIITPTASHWPFPVFIAQKKDGKPRLCVNYCTINRQMKADRWPLPRIEEIFDELRLDSVFTTLDLFAGYWQVRMSKSCKEMKTSLRRYGIF